VRSSGLLKSKTSRRQLETADLAEQKWESPTVRDTTNTTTTTAGAGSINKVRVVWPWSHYEGYHQYHQSTAGTGASGSINKVGRPRRAEQGSSRTMSAGVLVESQKRRSYESAHQRLHGRVI
jgi:hypothetical protein